MEHDRIVALKCISIDGCREHLVVAREVQLLSKVSISVYYKLSSHCRCFRRGILKAPFFYSGTF